MTQTTPASAPQSKKRRPSRTLIAVGAIGAVLAAGAATAAFSQGGLYKGMRHAGVEAEGMVQQARFRHGRPKTVEEAQERASRMAKHLAIEIDANGVQMDKLVEIAKGVAADVFPIRESIKTVREDAINLLSGDTVDRAKLETMRTEQFAKIEDVSKRLTIALADAAEVLNPEQRVKLAERVKEWRGRGGRGHGWGGRKHEGRGHHGGWGKHRRGRDE
ncbi:MAG: hypothetical protein KJ622_16165 [Alphaproteobacteria bacterium]|nr:hypothetical protein [Alphaproteobacteria bacterium]